jgi:hypothetical protein
MCRLITEAQRLQSLPPPRCGELTRDSVNGRAALVMQYDREGRTGPVHVYTIQVPTTDALVNLTLMSRVDAAKTNEPLFQRIWRSLSVPDTLGPRSSADGPH